MTTLQVTGAVPVKKVCHKAEDWDDWNDQTKRNATSLRIWKYIDPDSSTAQPEPVKESEYPQVTEDVSKVTQEHRFIVDMQYKAVVRRQADFDKFDNTCVRFMQYFNDSANDTCKMRLMDKATLRDMYKLFVEMYKPTERRSKEIYSARLHALELGQKGRMSMEDWSNAWPLLELRMSAVKHSNADELLSKFVGTIAKNDRSTAVTMYGKIYDDEGAAKWSLTKAVSYYINMNREVPTLRTHTANATFGDLNSDDNNDSNAPPPPPSGARNNNTRSKGCMHLTGKPEADNCATLAACTVANPKKRPAAKDRDSKYKKYLKNYLTKLKEDGNLLTNMRKKFPVDTEREKFLGGDTASTPTTGSNTKLVIDTAGNNDHEGSVGYTALVHTVHRTERAPVDTTDMWAYDSCANVHVVNHHLKASFQPRYTVRGAAIRAGTTVFAVVAYGDCTLDIGTAILHLHDVAYVPGFHTNIVAHCILERSGLWWHGFENALYRRDKVTNQDSLIAKLHKPNNDMPYLVTTTPAPRNVAAVETFANLQERNGTHAPAYPTSPPTNPKLTLFSHQSEPPTDLRKPVATSSKARAPRQLTMRQWHMMLGHAGKERLREFHKHVLGVEVVGDMKKQLDELRIEDCEVCSLSKSTRIYSRIQRMQETTPFGHIVMDTCYFADAYDGSKYMLHLSDLATSLEFAEATAFKKGETLTGMIMRVIQVANSMGRVVTRLSTDMDSALINPQGIVTKYFETALRNKGIQWTPATKEGHHQLPAETHGKRLIDTMRCLAQQSNLGIELWPEYMHAAVYILNRLPAPGKRGGKTPIELATGQKPNLSNLRMFGCKAYVHKVGADEPEKLQKTEARAHIGYLCGFIGNNIYRVWVPSQKRVITTSYVRFNERQFYRPGDLDIAVVTPGLLDDIDMPHMDPQTAIAKELRDLWLLGQRATDPAQGLITATPHNTDDHMQEPSANQSPGITSNNSQVESQTAAKVMEQPFLGNTPTLPPERDYPQYTTQADTTRKRGYEDSDAPSSMQMPLPEEPEHPHGPSEGVRQPEINIEMIDDDSWITSKRLRTTDYGLYDNGADEPRYGEYPTTVPDAGPLSPPTPPPPPDQGVELTSSTSEPVRYTAEDLARIALSEMSADDDAAPPFETNHEAHALTDITWLGTQSKLMWLSEPSYHGMTTAQSLQLHSMVASTVLLTIMSCKQEGPLHRRDLPPEPRGWKAMKKHKRAMEFTAAARHEWQKLMDMNTFQWVDEAEVPANERNLLPGLPLTWVFKYKFDEWSHHVRDKARLCARGDLQGTTFDTYAATVMACIFRFCCALAAAFGMEMEQFDVVNAFLNALLPYTMYVQAPEGFRQKGKVLRLLRALYGLKEAPMLWQAEFTASLSEFGLQSIPDVPCLYFDKKGVLVFFYVDDIVMIYHKKNKAHAQALKQRLFARYDMTTQGEVKWFLGIKIHRDRANKLIYLSQQEYIEHMARRFGVTLNEKQTNTPVPANMDWSVPEGYHSDKELILDYQQRVGSINWCAIETRPDVAKAASVLSRFLVNPTKAHLRAANHCIRYLLQTKLLCLVYGHFKAYSLHAHSDEVPLSQQGGFLGASDASFADHSDYKSSEGYVFFAFGGPTSWKASKQSTVTKSTTEAELTALSHAGSELIWWQNLFEQLNIGFDEKPTLYCDNQQTIRLITKQGTVNSKLRHVNIHQHWLRQEVQNEKLSVEHVPTRNMPADGLTKLLTAQQQQRFIAQLNLSVIPTPETQETSDTRSPNAHRNESETPPTAGIDTRVDSEAATTNDG